MKVLIVSYYWPPAGGPGVQRILKFVKYLPDYGWEPLVLTVDQGSYPALDPSLLDEIPQECKVYTSRNREPDLIYKKFSGISVDRPVPVGVLSTEKKSGWRERLSHWIRLNLFIPDAKILWKKNAVRVGRQIINEKKPDLIFSSSPPPTVHLIARDLAAYAGCKWVADFRDPWTKIHYYGKHRLSITEKIDKKLEKNILNKADRVICVSKKFSELLETFDRNKLSIIPNGFDESDFSKTYKRGSKFRMTYVGGLGANRYYRDVFEKIQDMLEKGCLNPELVELNLVGSLSNEIAEELRNQFEKFNLLKFHGYCEHPKAIEYMTDADILLLFLEKVEKYEGHIPGKLFEYMATGNFVLGFGRKAGETAEILKNTRSGLFATSGSAFETALGQQYEAWQKGIKTDPDMAEIKHYSRKALTAELVREFESVLQ